MIDETDIAMQFAASMEKRQRSLKMKDREREAADAKDNLPINLPPALDYVPDLTRPGELVPPDTTVEDPYSAVDTLAAVSGWFHPDDLFAEETDEQLRQLILSRLSPFCMVDTSGDQVRWCLKQNAREKILTRLRDQGSLEATLKRQLPPTDT